MATVSFFCTRCRRLTTFPASRRGAIVYCPRCQQALIVPDIPTTDGDEPEAENGENEQEGAFASTAFRSEFGQNEDAWVSDERREKKAERETSPRRFGATIASHLTPGKERPENWRRVEAGASNAPSGTNDELDDASQLTRTEVSDAEFLSRLRPDATSQPVVDPTVAPPVLWGVDKTRENAETAKIPKFIWGAVGAVMLGCAFVVGAFCLGNAKNGGAASANNQELANNGVFVEGALTYRTGNGAVAPDDGAFVFLFPNEERFGAPIALGDVSPQRPTPPGFENVVADLETRGARFAVADFEGRFAFDDLEPGEYRVLLVSRRVGEDWRNANPNAIKEIERYVVSPRLLAGQSRFFWTTRRFDRDAATLEKSFGKAGAPFANVD